ncbi:MAG: hypothetical protein WC231_01840 [Dehalococcoidales bacterium]|nr:hypothetical protein [Dehalococcoidales bacterium]
MDKWFLLHTAAWVGVEIAVGVFVSPAWALYLLIIAIPMLIISYWKIHKKESNNEFINTSYNKEPIPNKIRVSEVELISMARTMLRVHGHEDITGIGLDIKSGVLPSEVMFKPCHKCGIQRNKKYEGKYIW